MEELQTDDGPSFPCPATKWVEIVEPNSKKKIYAHLETGLCATQPPAGAIVSRAEDFSDHWWELYDKKTSKFYYYNPEKQKTVWSKPKESSSPHTNGERKRLLIIPVSKLQTYKSTTNGHNVEKCDASTQTIASCLVSTATQTAAELAQQEIDLAANIDTLNINNNSTFVPTTKPHSLSPQINKFNKSTDYSKSFDSASQHRRSTALGKPRDFYYERDNNDQIEKMRSQDLSDTPQIKPVTTTATTTTNHISSQQRQQGENNDKASADTKEFSTFFGTSSMHQRPRSTLKIQSPGNTNQILLRNNTDTDYTGQIPTLGVAGVRRQPRTPLTATVTSVRTQQQQQQPQHQQQLTTNNLSHYLVREARAMGIALISDDELDDDNPDSEEDCGQDDDEDTDMRDDMSSLRETASDLNASQELGEDSSDGWKSFSDQESPNGSAKKHGQSAGARQRLEFGGHQHQPIQIKTSSPIHCETTNSISFNDLIDDEKDPKTCMSQQLDHRKLVENFKKSRQSSAFGMHDSLGRSHKLDGGNNVQRIKTVADSYFNTNEKEPLSERQLRHLSTLSTLPRPHKGNKERLGSSSSRKSNVMDADYDIVDDDSSNLNFETKNLMQNSFTSSIDSSCKSAIKGPGSSEPHSPSSHFDRNKSTRGSTFSVESFARENLSRHQKKGGLLFNRKVKWSRMITWTKNSIKQSMISSISSDLNPDSVASFKLIQQFMGDRKVSSNKKYRQIIAQSASVALATSNDPTKDGNQQKSKHLTRSGSLGAGRTSNNNNSSHTSNSAVFNGQNLPDRLRDELAFELILKGCAKSALRDEIYIQMARQLTENPSQESTGWGLVLMSILLSYFSPSGKFAPFLVSFLETHSHQMARDVCLPRLEKRLRQAWLTYCRKPADGKEISIVRLSITKWPQYCGVFGESLERIMALQTCSAYLKNLRLPWILTTLGDKLIETGGAETEGIFRCAADHDLIAQLKLEIDCVDFRKITDAKQVHSLLSNVQDPHVIAGLLKLFFRQLYEPVFPSHLYDSCLQSAHDANLACRVFNERLSNLNKDVVAYLIRLLQSLSQPQRVAHTKMDDSNLSMVWAPNLLRLPQPMHDTSSGSVNDSKWSITAAVNGTGFQDDHHHHDQQSYHHSTSGSGVAPSQSIIFEQTRQEMQFLRALILHLDTSFIEKVT